MFFYSVLDNRNCPIVFSFDVLIDLTPYYIYSSVLDGNPHSCVNDLSEIQTAAGRVSRGQRSWRINIWRGWNPEHHPPRWCALMSCGWKKRESERVMKIFRGGRKLPLKWKLKKGMQCNVTHICWWKALISATLHRSLASGRDLTGNVWWCTFAWWTRAAALLIYHLTWDWEMCSQCQRNVFRGLCWSGTEKPNALTSVTCPSYTLYRPISLILLPTVFTTFCFLFSWILYV